MGGFLLCLSLPKVLGIKLCSAFLFAGLCFYSELLFGAVQWVLGGNMCDSAALVIILTPGQLFMQHMLRAKDVEVRAICALLLYTLRVTYPL